MIYRVLPLMIFTMLFLVMGMRVQAQASDIHIRYGQHIDKQRLVMDFDRRVSADVFTLEGPNRIVIDVPKQAWRVNVSDTVSKGGVKTVRIGDYQSNTSRIVIDMAQATSIEQFFWLPPVNGLKDRLVIDYQKLTGKPSSSSVLQQKSLNQVLEETLKVPSGEVPLATSSVYLPPKKPSKFAQEVASQQPKYKPLIVIDAGHGGKDSGAVAKNGMFEKTVVLKIAKELAQALDKTGRYRTMLTRKGDYYIPLKKRIGIAREHEADLFISVHADSIGNRNVSGASVYTLSEKASDAQTARLAARENKSDIIAGIDLSTEDPDVTNILLDLVARETTNQSKFFANLIVDEFQGHRVKTLVRPHRHAGFAVLKAPDVPAILVETGFMSNPKEVQKLSDPKYRKVIAESLVSGVDAYFMRLALLNAE